MNPSFHIAELIIKSIKDELFDDEKQLLNEWIGASEDNQILFDKLTKELRLAERVALYESFDRNRVWKTIEDELTVTKTLVPSQRPYLRYAASILLPLLIAAGLIYVFLMQEPTDSLAHIDEQIQPGGQKAVLKLADGVLVDLEAENSPEALKEGGTIIENKGQQLAYTPDAKISATAALVYNELLTPLGGTYQVKLSDGTRVTLNAGSSLKYPVQFRDSTRTVFLTGEAYFNVTHTGAPFIVSNGSQNIRVLGTSFNVSAYDNESTITTTLIEGQVAIETESQKQLLEPGQQAVLQRSSTSIMVREVNTDQYTSWMRGKFEFNKDNMDVVIKRLARWYDFTYVFENKEAMDNHFTGRIESSQPISSILEMLEATSEVKFELNDRTIIIK